MIWKLLGALALGALVFLMYACWCLHIYTRHIRRRRQWFLEHGNNADRYKTKGGYKSPPPDS